MYMFQIKYFFPIYSSMNSSSTFFIFFKNFLSSPLHWFLQFLVHGFWFFLFLSITIFKVGQWQHFVCFVLTCHFFAFKVSLNQCARTHYLAFWDPFVFHLCILSFRNYSTYLSSVLLKTEIHLISQGVQNLPFNIMLLASWKTT